MKIVICSGGFDPVHSGHIAYFRAAKNLGNLLVVGVNSDEWLTRKRGKPFMPLEERLTVIQSIRFVDYTMKFNDDDDSARHLIKNVKLMWPGEEFIFANGGDRNETNNRESDVTDVEFVFGVGGSHKMNSSSCILKKWIA